MIKDLFPNKRFNLYPESVIVEVIYHSANKDLSSKEIFDKLTLLIEEAEILHDRSIPNERMLIVKRGKQHYSISVTGNHQYNRVRIVPFLSVNYDVVLESFNNYIDMANTKGKVA